MPLTCMWKCTVRGTIAQLPHLVLAMGVRVRMWLARLQSPQVLRITFTLEGGPAIMEAVTRRPLLLALLLVRAPQMCERSWVI